MVPGPMVVTLETVVVVPTVVVPGGQSGAVTMVV
jgi:hypothetical protein